jgi:hypothetical protein
MRVFLIVVLVAILMIGLAIYSVETLPDADSTIPQSQRYP